MYYAADPLDKGIVNSGKYTFVPILDGYTIEDAKKENITQIVAIGNKELGKGF